MSMFRRRLMMGSKKSYMFYFPLIQMSATLSRPSLTLAGPLNGFVQGKTYRIKFNYHVVAHKTTTTTAYVRIYVSNQGAFSFKNLKLQLVPTTPGDYTYTGAVDTTVTADLAGTTMSFGGRFDNNASDFTIADLYISEVV